MEIRELKKRAERFQGKIPLRVDNPATGELIAELVLADGEGIGQALDEAERGFKAWRLVSGDHRSEVLRGAAALIRNRKRELSLLLTTEQGKTLRESGAELDSAAQVLDWYAEEARRVYGSALRVSSDKDIVVLKEPVGVCAAITTWNFPASMVTRKAGGAIAAGCSMVLKPAPDTPLIAFALEEIFEEAGVPRGGLTVVNSESDAFSDRVCTDPRVRKLSFTGSTRTGKLLMQKASQSLLRLTMELGGNAAFIVCEDADLERAVTDAVFAKFRNGGQACTSVNRFLVHADVHDSFVAELQRRVSALTVGNGADEGVDVGPLINDVAVTKVVELVDSAERDGAKRVLGGSTKGRFVSPVVLTNVTPSMRIAREEIFGPVCAVYRYSSDEEAISMANETVWGLANYVYTNSLKRAHHFTRALESGMVGLNDCRLSAIVQAPFGGVKHSGFGREGGREGIEEFLTLKYVLQG